MNKKSIILIAFLPIYLIATGCSFSKSSKSFSRSSKSISKSASSPSRWLSRSSKKDKSNVNTAAYSYQDEVITLATLYAESGGTSQNFQRELSIIASNHGIIAWENNINTFESIGIGLKQGGILNKSIKTLSFLQTKTFVDNYSLIVSGYNFPDNIS
ncbi:MAG: putative lipoprotein [bacterium]|nr:putative lipoprotein [bacterium]